VVVERREVWWAVLDDPGGADDDGFRRPLLIVQADSFNRSRLPTVLAVVLTSNVRLIDAPGNVLLSAGTTGLPEDTVANVTQLVTVDRDFLQERAGRIPPRTMARVESGIRLALDH
jgi:mRNA interferase MazF